MFKTIIKFVDVLFAGPRGYALIYGLTIVVGFIALNQLFGNKELTGVIEDARPITTEVIKNGDSERFLYYIDVSVIENETKKVVRAVFDPVLSFSLHDYIFGGSCGYLSRLMSAEQYILFKEFFFGKNMTNLAKDKPVPVTLLQNSEDGSYYIKEFEISPD